MPWKRSSPRSEALAEITAGIQAELDDPSDPGSTQAIN